MLKDAWETITENLVDDVAGTKRYVLKQLLELSKKVVIVHHEYQFSLVRQRPSAVQPLGTITDVNAKTPTAV